jgi:hypothetical protein
MVTLLGHRLGAEIIAVPVATGKWSARALDADVPQRPGAVMTGAGTSTRSA